MDEAYLISFAQNALTVVLILAGPILATSLVVGILVSLFQTVTQINEATLTFVPKILGIGLVMAFLGSWMAQQLIAFTANIFMSLPNLPR